MSLANFDLTIVRYLNQNFSVYLGYLSIFTIYSVYVYLIFLAYHFFRTKKSDKLFHLFITSVLGYIFVVSLKFLFARPRPYEVDPSINVVFKKADPAFPSSHAFIAYLSFFFLPKSFPKWLRYIASIYLLILIPLASLYSGVHYPSDIAVGAILGIIIPRLISEKASAGILKRIFR